MAKIGLQSKYQILMKPELETSSWKDLSSVMTKRQSASTSDDSFAHFNNMPPGEDIMNQFHVENFIDGGLAGETSVTDHVSSSITNGYTRGEMHGIDDQCTGDSIDLWYGEAVAADGKTGFLLRNNYLSRLT